LALGADLWLIGGRPRFDVWLLRRAGGLSLGIEEDRAAAAAMGFVDDSKGADFFTRNHLPPIPP
jgi:hypothetical protein